jgi:TonB family protein
MNRARVSRSLGAAMLCAAVLTACATERHYTTEVQPDPTHPILFGENYPAESKRLHEEGTCKVKLTVTAKGEIRNVSLAKSTGYPRLDEVCLKAFAHGGLLPATRDGKPVTSTLEVPITWTLAAAPQ